MICKYAVHDAAGNIRRIVKLTFGNDPAPAARMLKASRQARPGEFVVELPEGFNGDDLTHRIEGGEPVPI